MKKILKILGIALLIIVLLFAALLGWSEHLRKTRAAQRAAEPTKDPNELSFVVEDSAEPLEVPTSSQSRYSDLLLIFDAADYDLFFPPEHVTAADCKAVIQKNDAIPAQYKTLLSWFVDAIETHYPEADLRPLRYNLDTLEILEVSDRDLLFASLSADAYGCYIRTENRIYVKEGYEYVPRTWDYQVIIHEFGHAARMVHRDLDDVKVRVQALPPESGFTVIDEALNSLFAVSLFDYEEPDVAYQLQSNLFQILLECLDGVDAGDSHDIPSGSVYSLRRNANASNRTFSSKVGANFIKVDITEVYSR